MPGCGPVAPGRAGPQRRPRVGRRRMQSDTPTGAFCPARSGVAAPKPCGKCRAHGVCRPVLALQERAPRSAPGSVSAGARPAGQEAGTPQQDHGCSQPQAAGIIPGGRGCLRWCPRPLTDPAGAAAPCRRVRGPSESWWARPVTDACPHVMVRVWRRIGSARAALAGTPRSGRHATLWQARHALAGTPRSGRHATLWLAPPWGRKPAWEGLSPPESGRTAVCRCVAAG